MQNLPRANFLINHIRSRINQSGKGSALTDSEVLEMIVDAVYELEEFAFTGIEEKRSLIDRTFYSLRCEYGILQPLLDDKSISEIMVNGPDNVFIEQNGKIKRSSLTFESNEELENIIRKMAGRVRREINEMNPIVDARLEDGSRVNAVYKNIALGCPVLTIRKFPEKPLTMENLIASGSITEEAANFLKTLVEAGYNIFISGGTSSGKTTFLNVLSNYIPKEERVIVIEDSAELQIREIENLVRMECKNANSQGKGKIDMKDLIKSSLRMRPDRIIVGEVRGGEVLDMIQAMNTGHDGSLCTGHGNSVSGMMKRLEAMFLQAANFPAEAIRNQIAEGIDIVVHMGRLSDKKRRILEISEILKVDAKEGIHTNPLFVYKPGSGLLRTGTIMQNTAKLELSGLSIPPV